MIRQNARPATGSRPGLAIVALGLAVSLASAQPPEQLPPPTLLPSPDRGTDVPRSPDVAPRWPGAEVPPWLPRYGLDVRLDVAGHKAHVRQRVVWTNRHSRPAAELVFNAHAHFTVSGKDLALVTKTLEVLRMSPGEAIDFGPPPLEVEGVTLVGERRPDGGPVELLSFYQQDNDTALVVPLPRPVGQGESVAVDLTYSFRLPQKQGRWGQWRGLTTLSNWVPVLAYYDEGGWQPTPFIPWHQPFFNEAGVYHVSVTLPAEQVVACTGSIVGELELPDQPGWKRVDVVAVGVRDFAFLCSDRFREFTDTVNGVKIRSVAFPEHEHYARVILRQACEVLPAYEAWMGPYPWPQLTFVEAYFGWNGNECATLVMVDERLYGMPHLAGPYVEYLIVHETCHQWWYNLMGTNGYCETWLDEGMANYFCNRFLNKTRGKNNPLLNYPRGFGWLPNIQRENYRLSGLYGTLGRGEETVTVQEMPKFGHVFTLFSMCYDKGGQVFGMIEDRLGEANFIGLMHRLYRKYQYRVIRVADLQRELEEFTGQSWGDFFERWVHGKGLCDWSVEHVEIEEAGPGAKPGDFLDALRPSRRKQPVRVTVTLHQCDQYDEQTVLGICLDDKGPQASGYQVRIPIIPGVPSLELDGPHAVVETLPEHRVRVVVDLPRRPTQIAVDPDQVLVDRDPSNNYWKVPVRWRLTPLYTFLEETSLTCDYDRWNVIVGPWAYMSTWEDPWYTRSAMLGVRAGVYRTERFVGGIYGAYRYDYRDTVVGADALWQHVPLPQMQIGANVEQRLDSLYDANQHANRSALFARWVFLSTSSFYMRPVHYVEAFAKYQDNFLPYERYVLPEVMAEGASQRPLRTLGGGLHYHLDLRTPYWDPENGFMLDASYSGGMVEFNGHDTFQTLTAQLSWVHPLPEFGGWFPDSRLAARLYGGTALPTRGEFFTLGGNDLFRGFDLRERQGNTVWVGSLEWRVPLARRLNLDALDHAIGVRTVQAAVFYDVGDALLDGKSYGPVAHAAGVGLRFDLAWLGFIERTLVRFDVAKTLNAESPWQFWLGFQQPF